jgi:hypothetical protein
MISTLAAILGFTALPSLPSASSVVPSDIAAPNGVVSPFQLEMTRSDLYTVISQSLGQAPISGQFSFPLADFTVTTPIKVALTGLQLNVNYTLSPPVLDPATLNWTVSTQKISAELVVQKIDATQIIHVTEGNVDMNIPLNGVCSQVHVALPEGSATGSVTGNLDFTNRTPQFQFRAFNAGWTPGSWQVTSQNCQGPMGFDTVIKQNIEAQLQQIAPFTAQLEDQLQSFINQRLSQPLPLQLGAAPSATSSSPYAVSMTPQFYDLALPRASDSTKDFVRVSGSLVFAYPGLAPDSGCAVNIPAFTDAPSQDITENSLVVPFQTIPALLKCAQLSKSLLYQFDSTDVDGFQRLEGSRIKQFAIWPDLLKFSEDTVFGFTASSETAPLISEQKSEGTHRIAMNLTAPIDVDMSAPDHGTNVPYMHFSSPIEGLAHVLIEGGHATLTIDKDTPFKMDHHWDETYKSNHFMNPIMIGGPIQSATHELLTSTGISVVLPVLNISPGTIIAFEEGDVEQSNLKLRLAVAKSPPPAPVPNPSVTTNTSKP